MVATLKKPSLSKKSRSKYHQGIYTPRHPEKYLGSSGNIIYRSKWELMFLRWADETPAVLRYSSEECVIPYISPIDGKYHKYYIDFFISVLQTNGMIKNFLVEVKPYSQTIPPVLKKKRITESYQEALRTYAVNQAKWEAARSVCQKRGWDFIIITEKQLFRKQKDGPKKKSKNIA